jgi:hypothetical protein
MIQTALVEDADVGHTAHTTPPQLTTPHTRIHRTSKHNTHAHHTVHCWKIRAARCKGGAIAHVVVGNS